GLVHAERARVRRRAARQRHDWPVAGARGLVRGADPPQRSSVCQTGSTAVGHSRSGRCCNCRLVSGVAIRTAVAGGVLYRGRRLGAAERLRIGVMSVLDAIGAIMAYRPGLSSAYANTLLAFTIVMSIVIALGMHLLVFEDMTDEIRRTNLALAAANEEVNRLAITDALTGCYNRRFYDEIGRRELERHRRYGKPLSVMFVDLNRFKHLNDRFGHDTGDQVLRTLGALLQRQVRQSDYVIRWGGDEFLLLLTCTAEEAVVKAEELKAAFAHERDVSDLPTDIGLSVGVAAVEDKAETLAHAIRVADAEMYRDKLADRRPA